MTQTSVDLAARCAADGEFRLASRHWTGGLRLVLGEAVAAITLRDGAVSADDPGEADGVVTLSGSNTVWAELLAAVPRPFFNDIAPAQAMGPPPDSRSHRIHTVKGLACHVPQPTCRP